MSLELELKEMMYRYFEEHPDVVPDLFEFVEWLYDILFWENANKMLEGPTSITEKFPKDIYSKYYESKEEEENE